VPASVIFRAATVLAVIASPFIGCFAATAIRSNPTGAPLLWGRSHCGHCGQRLELRDLVPVFSWLLALGRCRYCRKPISLLYPVVELAFLGAALWASQIEDQALILPGIFLGWVLITLFAFDITAFVLPNVLTYALLLCGLALSLASGREAALESAIGTAAGGASLLLVKWAYRLIKGREGLGMGDVKLFAAAAAYAAPGLCAAASGGLTWASGGTAGQAFMAFTQAFVSMGVWGQVGKDLIGAAIATQIFFHGVVQGVLSLTQGGNFFQGFAIGAISEGATAETRGLNVALRLAAVSAAGGLVSQLTGGKFANGAVSAAFAFLYNEMSSRFKPPETQTPGLWTRFVAGATALAEMIAASTAATAAAVGAVFTCALTCGSTTVATGTMTDAIKSALDDDNYEKTHGNSLSSKRLTWLYELVNSRDGTINGQFEPAGGVAKYGITSADPPRSRYPSWFYALSSTDMEPIMQFPDRASARAAEAGLCSAFFAQYGRMPRLSATC